MKRMIFVLALIISLSQAFAQQSDEDYRKVIYGRAENIVKTLDIQDKVKYDFLVELIANQYIDLGVINDAFGAKEKEIKDSSLSSDEKTQAKELAYLRQRQDLTAKHYYFVNQLNASISPEQIEKVKDGMTMDQYPVQYKAQLEMIPSLTEEEKTYIRAAYMEAREYAMDCSDSKAKHAWFGKYKGRINNYLSKRGYNLTKEREAWYERIKAAQAK
ncbi:MAG: DUF3826 domain-containing protein [Bacteroidales bacterium]|nr:DUF3826 domain-containing protein [Bacteroidales bacterium]